jgi:membrane associated rhomboid family serine protease/Zn-finger nucleic acid-binding protein
MMNSKRCARCRSRLLEPLRDHEARIDACVGCGGLWFDPGELANAIRTHDPGAIPTDRVFESLGKRGGEAKLVCPRCRVNLVEYSLSDQNPLPVDACETCHGIWLEQGELAHAQAGHQLAPARATIERDRTWGHWFFQFISMLPVEFNIKPRRRPVVTYTLIAVSCAALLVTMLDPAPFARLMLIPDHFGQPQWWLSLLTSQLIHLGWIHLLGNMYFLWILGDNVEDLLGPWKFLAFYLSAAVAGDIVYSLLSQHPEIPMAGASGAISGVIAAYAVYFRHSKLTFMVFVLQFKLRVTTYFGIWVAFNLGGWLVGSPGVAWESHAGGFAFGLLFGLGTRKRLMRRRPLLSLLNSASTEAS